MSDHFDFAIVNKCDCHLVQIQLLHVYTPLQSSLNLVFKNEKRDYYDWYKTTFRACMQ